jgi:hypothetical protein
MCTKLSSLIRNQNLEELLVSWAKRFDDFLAKNVIVKLFTLHRFINLFSLHLCSRIIFLNSLLYN